MNKFNLPRRNIQKERRLKRAERRKQKTSPAPVKVSDVSSNSNALALKVSSTHSGYLSGKNRAKLQKKWRRAQKEALQSGLVTMHDIEMMTAEVEEVGTDEGSMQLPSLPKLSKKTKFSMKKRAKLRTKSAGQVSEPAAISSVDGGDAMMQ